MQAMLKENVWIEEATELTLESVLENRSKILQMFYVTEEQGVYLFRDVKKVHREFCAKVNEWFPRRGTLEQKKEFLLKLLNKYKQMYPHCFPEKGWWDKKVAKERLGTTSL